MINKEYTKSKIDIKAEENRKKEEHWEQIQKAIKEAPGGKDKKFILEIEELDAVPTMNTEEIIKLIKKASRRGKNNESDFLLADTR